MPQSESRCKCFFCDFLKNRILYKFHDNFIIWQFHFSRSVLNRLEKTGFRDTFSKTTKLYEISGPCCWIFRGVLWRKQKWRRFWRSAHWRPFVYIITFDIPLFSDQIFFSIVRTHKSQYWKSRLIQRPLWT